MNFIRLHLIRLVLEGLLLFGVYKETGVWAIIAIGLLIGYVEITSWAEVVQSERLDGVLERLRKIR